MIPAKESGNGQEMRPQLALIRDAGYFMIQTELVKRVKSWLSGLWPPTSHYLDQEEVGEHMDRIKRNGDSYR